VDDFEKAQQINPRQKVLAPALQNPSSAAREKNFVSTLQTRFSMNVLTAMAIVFGRAF
jgi:hypothetical protein